MNRLSLTRNLRVPPHAPDFCALPSNRSLFSASSTTLLEILFFAVANLLAHAALYGALWHSLRAPPHRSVPPLNLHRARVRRNRGRLPSSRCIESAQTHRARACALPTRASDTTLGLLVTYLDRDMEFVWTPKHLEKMSWHRSSSVQIKPLQPTNSFFSANPATIRIDSLDFQSGRRSKREIVSESPSSERRLLWATS